MALYPYVIAPWFEQRFLLADGTPNAGGFVYTRVAATSTPIDVYTTANGTAHTNPIELDSDGRPPSPIFVPGTGIKFLVHDSDDVLLYTVDLVEDAGSVFAGTWGTLLGTGVTYTTGQTIATTTRLALIDSSSGATTIYLSAAADMTQPLTVKNRGGNAVTLTADGTDTIEVTLSSITIPAASSPTFPSVTLASDGISNTTLLASHGM